MATIKPKAQIVKKLQQFIEKTPETKRINPLEFHNICYSLKTDIEFSTEGLEDIKFFLRENNQSTKAEAIEKLYGQLLESLSPEYNRRSDGLAPMWLELTNARNCAKLLLAELKKISDQAGETKNQRSAETRQIIYSRSKPTQELIAQRENQTLEFKETLQYNIKSKQVDRDVRDESLKTICGFLNADGGTLLIGISDSGEVKGIEKDKKAMNNANDDKFELKIRDFLFGQNSKFEPEPLKHIKISFEKIQDHTICMIDVQPFPKQKISHLDGKVYIRDGNQTLKLEGPKRTNWTKERLAMRN